jgi:choice-of-anchor B domain-containing protein
MIKRISLISIVLLQSIIGFSQLNINLVGQLTFPGKGDLSDIWGHVDGSGNEYALVGTNTGTSIVDISTPSSPVEVFFSNGPSSIWRDLKVWNNHLYITNESSGGLKIIDMSNLPGAITTGDVYQFNGSTYPFTSAHDLYIDENGYAYILGADNGVGGAIILNLNIDPKNPVEVGRYDDFYLHDGMVRGDTLWGGAVNDGFFVAVDVSNKATPITMVTQTTPNAFTHNCWISDDGQTLYTTDEKSNAFIASYDVSNFSNISELDRVQSSPGDNVIPHNTFFINDYVVTSYYRDGVTIHDVSNPSNMVEVGNYDTSPAFSGDGFNGNWGVYPYLPSGLIIASDIENGLYILGPTYVRAANLAGNVTDSITTANLDAVQVDIVSTTVSTNTNILGDYITGIATPGTYSVTYSKFGYETKTITNVSLTSGNITTLNVELAPIISFTYQGKVIETSTSNPIPNASVKVYSSLFTTTVLTDGAGNFSVPNLIAGNYDVYIAKWGYKTLCLTNSSLSPTGNPHQYSLDDGYYDDFVLDLGWTVTGNASAGVWERDAPAGTSYFAIPSNPGSDASSDCDDKAYVTGNGGGNAGDDDVDGGQTILTSPIFDLSSYVDPNVNFDRWFFNAGGTGTPNDSLVITLSNGTTTAIIDFANVNDLDLSSWSSKSIRVLDFMSLTSTMQLTLRAMDISPGHISEAAIDKFEVVEMSTISVASNVVNTSLFVYPNPFNNEINIKVNDNKIKTLKVEVYEVTGKLIDTKEFKNSQTIKIINNYQKGIYFVNIYGNGVLIKTEKLIKL